MKWEYNAVFITGNDDRPEKILNDFGEEGWELIAIRQINTTDNRMNPIQYSQAIFKRPIKPSVYVPLLDKNENPY